eukprot:CAMPEP_0171304754 /NCGR_PEP_ID=MMETSP0816-20121228/14504_1 /TAXON_ID=420281 /ORGANISM="Proboscia inermis, Strain CCAP1064/1" /LENGTH=179 /DNA_ID=CAMNT_0011785055 /DNA_START=61 /DNA_END=600 /DNA_ORIENTATION=+
MYPWAMLVVLQFIMPNISFWGHLSGILVGTLQVYGVLDIVCLPSEEYLRNMESWKFIRNIAQKPSFVRTPISDSPETGASVSRSPSMLCGVVAAFFMSIVKNFRDVIETIQYCIFGSERSNPIPQSPTPPLVMDRPEDGSVDIVHPSRNLVTHANHDMELGNIENEWMSQQLQQHYDQT